VLGRYVREQNVLTWEDAVRKMSGLPAATIGLVDRGLLAVGMAADVVVFDPAAVIDHATFEAPMRPSTGVRHVLVNGRLALRDGAPTAERAGRALRRATEMIARPMNGREARAVAVRAVSADGTAEIDLRQARDATRATGTVRLSMPGRGLTIATTELGQLQTAPRWSSVTGVATVQPADPPRAVTVVVDGDDVVIRAAEVSYRGTVRR
jgi:hypothetical protein